MGGKKRTARAEREATAEQRVTKQKKETQCRTGNTYIRKHVHKGSNGAYIETCTLGKYDKGNRMYKGGGCLKGN